MANSISFNCKTVTTDPNSSKSLSVSADDVDIEEVVNNFSVTEIITAIGAGALLDEIGVDKCIDHFGLDAEDRA